MKKIIVLALGIVMATGVTAGAANPSYTGTTGAILTPTGDVISIGSYDAMYTQSTNGNNKMGSIGLGVAQQLEVSVAHEWGSNSQTYLNAKYGILREGVALPAVAVGVNDITNEKDVSPYVVMSKTLPMGFRFSLGYGNGQYNGAFGSVEKTINPLIVGGDDVFPATTLVLEYDSTDWNYGARVALAGGAKATIGHFYHRTYVGLTFSK
jgi:hypothetical protein